MLFYTCFIVNLIRSGETFAFSEEVREKHIGFKEIGQGKFVLLKQESVEFFSESPYKPWYSAILVYRVLNGCPLHAGNSTPNSSLQISIGKTRHVSSNLFMLRGL